VSEANTKWVRGLPCGLIPFIIMGNMNKPHEHFVVQGVAGKKKLKGEVRISGAKNAALKMLAATVLFKDAVLLRNAPDIEDIGRMADLLSDIGVAVSSKNKSTLLCTPGTLKTKLSPEISKRLRASIVLTGPLLARMGKISFPHPGGCVIGERPIDLFIESFEKMGARVKHADGAYQITAPAGKLRGAELFFRTQSVTGTETFMMAGVLAKGKTIIRNAAMEPEIKHLADYLVACGAHIRGAGTPTIEIHGGALLRARGRAYTTPADRIEAGSFLVLGALAAESLNITHCDPMQLESLIEVLTLAGVPIRTTKNSIHIYRNTKPNSSFKNVEMIKTHEYPGFPTDLQAPMTVFLTQASGECLMFETIFEGRLNYVEELIRMGADIKIMDPHRVIVEGPHTLRARELESPDLRAGLAFVIAAIVARGKSVIHNVYNIDRGYECVEEKLQGIGVAIKRVED